MHDCWSNGKYVMSTLHELRSLAGGAQNTNPLLCTMAFVGMYPTVKSSALQSTSCAERSRGPSAMMMTIGRRVRSDVIAARVAKSLTKWQRKTKKKSSAVEFMATSDSRTNELIDRYPVIIRRNVNVADGFGGSSGGGAFRCSRLHRTEVA